MSRVLTTLAGLLLCVGTVYSDGKPLPASDAAKQYKELIAEFEKDGEVRESAGRFLKLAGHYPTDPVATDALVWIVENVRRGRELEQAMTALAKDHSQNPKLAAVCGKLAFRPSLATERLLRVLREKSPHKDVRAPASLFLAVYLQRQLRLIDALKQEEDPQRFAQFYGEEFATHLKELDVSASLREIEQIYEDVSRKFADVPIEDTTMGEAARLQLYAIRNLSLGRTAPEITGEDIDGKSFKLSDYRGKVVLLDFWGHW